MQQRSFEKSKCLPATAHFTILIEIEYTYLFCSPLYNNPKAIRESKYSEKQGL